MHDQGQAPARPALSDSKAAKVHNPVLRVRNLRTHFHLDEGILKAVDGINLEVMASETVALIGESGSGKSVLAHSILHIVPEPGRIEEGSIEFFREENAPIDIARLGKDSAEMRSLRGKSIAMIFQEPMTSLSPVHTIGNQIIEAVLLHVTRNRRDARERVIAMLEKVGISNPRTRFREYPHQFSGGMRQRAMIAMALVCRPSILIADEPTTALDVTVQAQIIELIRNLQAELGMSVLYITHDLGVVAGIADLVCVMYLGKIVESAPTREILDRPLHPYTLGLLKAVPHLGKKSGKPLHAIPGNVPPPIGLPRRCGFYSRCEKSVPGLCDCKMPAMVETSPGHSVRCFLINPKQEASDHA